MISNGTSPCGDPLPPSILKPNPEAVDKGSLINFTAMIGLSFWITSATTSAVAGVTTEEVVTGMDSKSDIREGSRVGVVEFTDGATSVRGGDVTMITSKTGS